MKINEVIIPQRVVSRFTDYVGSRSPNRLMELDDDLEKMGCLVYVAEF